MFYFEIIDIEVKWYGIIFFKILRVKIIDLVLLSLIFDVEKCWSVYVLFSCIMVFCLVKLI